MAPRLVVDNARRLSGEPYLKIAPSTRPWLVKGMLPATGVAFLVGATQAGKSFLGIDFSLRIASGMKVMERRTRNVGVAYLGAEDAEGCRTRIVAWRETYRRSDLPFDFYDQPINLLDQGDLACLAEGLVASAARFEAMGKKLGLIVIDTMSRCLPGIDENNSQGMSQAFTNLVKLGQEFGALILVVAHYGKAGEEKGIRGWSGMNSNSDATVTLERDEDDPDLRTLTIHKVKNGRDGYKTSFRLQDVELDTIDDDGEALTSCICAYEETPTKAAVYPRKKAMNNTEQVVLVAIRDVTDSGKTQPPPHNVAGVQAWTKAISRKDLVAALAQSAFAVPGEPVNTTTKRLSRALEGLSAQQRIGVRGDLIWIVDFNRKGAKGSAAV